MWGLLSALSGAAETKEPGQVGAEIQGIYLQNYKREVYNGFQSDSTLDEHVAEIDQRAKELFERLVEQIAMRQGITEQLKVDNRWHGSAP